MENSSEEEIIARDDHLTPIADHKYLVEKHSKYLNLNSTHLEDLRTERKAIHVWLKEKGIRRGKKSLGQMKVKQLFNK